MSLNIFHVRLLFGLLMVALVAVALRAVSLQAATMRNTGVLALNQSVVTVNDQTQALAAASRLRNAAALNPTHLSTQRLLGFAYLAQEREDAALKAWQRAGDMGQELLARGNALEETGMEAEALRWYQYAATVAPQLPESYLRAGAILEQKEAWSSAVDIYRAGVSAGGLSSESSDLYFKLANALSRTPEPIRWLDVLSAAEQAAALNNFGSAYNAIQVHYVMGLALLALERPHEAQAAFKQVVAARPSDYWSSIQLGRLAWTLDGDAALAERHFEAAIAHDPAAKAAYRHLAELQVESGQQEAAIATYKRLLAIHPDDASVRERLNALHSGN